MNVKQAAIWGLIGGDKIWRKSAYALKQLIKGRPSTMHTLKEHKGK